MTIKCQQEKEPTKLKGKYLTWRNQGVKPNEATKEHQSTALLRKAIAKASNAVNILEQFSFSLKERKTKLTVLMEKIGFIDTSAIWGVNEPS